MHGHDRISKNNVSHPILVFYLQFEARSRNVVNINIEFLTSQSKKRAKLSGVINITLIPVGPLSVDLPLVHQPKMLEK